MAGRTPPASRGRTASTTRGSGASRARKQPVKQAARQPARRTAARRTPARRQSAGSVLAGGIGRGVGALWMGLAHSVGWVARGVGRQAATAREHEQPGAVWAGSAGPVGTWVADAVRLFLGGLAVLLPLLLLYGAVRLMRKPADPEHRGRSVVGWTAILVATASLLHVAQRPATDVEMTTSGGLVGFGVGALLERAVTAWVAVPLLVLLLLFGLLVITATPISKVPERLMLLGDVLLGRSTTRAPLPEPDDLAEPDGDDEDDAAPKTRRPARRRQGALADLGLDPEADADDDLIVHETVVLDREARVPASRKAPPEPPEHSPLPTRAEQLDISAVFGALPLPSRFGGGRR